MPDKTVFVTGTNTEVGKTWLTARLALILKESGIEVAARKPVMSFDATDESTDAGVLAQATGESESVVCPPHRRYELPMAPPMAGEVLGREPFSIDELFAELALPDGGVAFVEGVGGPRSPLAADGDSVSLIHRLDPDHVVLVAESRLGVISDVLTSRDSVARDVLVFLNRYDASDDLHARNLEWLTKKSGLTVFTEPEPLAGSLAERAPTNLGGHSDDHGKRKVEVQ